MQQPKLPEESLLEDELLYRPYQARSLAVEKQPESALLSSPTMTQTGSSGFEDIIGFVSIRFLSPVGLNAGGAPTSQGL